VVVAACVRRLPGPVATVAVAPLASYPAVAPLVVAAGAAAPRRRRGRARTAEALASCRSWWWPSAPPRSRARRSPHLGG
jgi:hypothetical protein